MIAENMIYYAIAVFILLVIGLVLTVLEFRYGDPHKQRKALERQNKQANGLRDSIADGSAQ